MTYIFFSKFKNMNDQLPNALSTMFLRRLVIFLHFETYALENLQKLLTIPDPGGQLSFLPHIYMRQEAKFDPGFAREPRILGILERTGLKV